MLAIKSRTSRPGIEFQKFSRSNRWSRLTSPLQDGSGGRNFRGTKKERRLAPPLRVEVSELRLRKTADPPRPSQLRPVSQVSAPGLRSRVTYTRLIYRRLSAFQLLRTFVRSAACCRSLSSFRLVGCPARAFPNPGPRTAEAVFDPDFRWPEPASVFQPVEACASWRLSQGIAYPFRVTP